MLDLSYGKTGIFHSVSGVSVIKYALIVDVVNVVVDVVAVVVDVDVVFSAPLVAVAEVTSSLRGTNGNLGTLSLQAAG